MKALKEEGHSAVTRGVKTATFCSYKHRFVCNCNFNFGILTSYVAIIFDFCNLPDSYVHDCVKVISNTLYY